MIRPAAACAKDLWGDISFRHSTQLSFLCRRLAAYVAWIMEILDKSGAGNLFAISFGRLFVAVAAKWDVLRHARLLLAIAGWMHGIHAVPSLRQLHVHLLTLDMNAAEAEAELCELASRPPVLPM